MASQHGSRKRQKVSPTQARDMPYDSVAATPNIVNQTTGISNVDNMATGTDTKASTTASDCSHKVTLKALHTDLESMRSLVTCKICDRLMYEPYSLACGHAYCYSCLSQWLVSNHKKTCPDCRSSITRPPNPSYIVRELVLIFVSRTELLPEGETSEEHEKWAKEEREIVAKDKANTDSRHGGLFKGCFRNSKRLQSILYDPGDGVSRCPICLWEVEVSGYCQYCGEYDESDVSDDELDDEIDLMDGEAVFGGPDDQEDVWGRHDGDDDNDDPTRFAPSEGEDPRTVLAHRDNARTHGHSMSSYRYRNLLGHVPGSDEYHEYDDEDDDEEDEDEDEDDSELNDFIVDDEAEESEAETDEDSEATEVQATYNARPTNNVHTRRGARVVLSDDDGDDDDNENDEQGHREARRRNDHAANEHASSALRAGAQDMANTYRAVRNTHPVVHSSSDGRAGPQSDGESSNGSESDSEEGDNGSVSSTLRSDDTSINRCDASSSDLDPAYISTMSHLESIYARGSSDLDPSEPHDGSEIESVRNDESYDEGSIGSHEGYDEQYTNHCDEGEDFASESGMDNFDYSEGENFQDESDE